jgi:hypothetical protein
MLEIGLYTNEPVLQHLGRPERLELPAGNQPSGWHSDSFDCNNTEFAPPEKEVLTA